MEISAHVGCVAPICNGSESVISPVASSRGTGIVGCGTDAGGDVATKGGPTIGAVAGEGAAVDDAAAEGPTAWAPAAEGPAAGVAGHLRNTGAAGEAGTVSVD